MFSKSSWILFDSLKAFSARAGAGQPRGRAGSWARPHSTGRVPLGSLQQALGGMSMVGLSYMQSRLSGSPALLGSTVTFLMLLSDLHTKHAFCIISWGSKRYSNIFELVKFKLLVGKKSRTSSVEGNLTKSIKNCKCTNHVTQPFNPLKFILQINLYMRKMAHKQSYSLLCWLQWPRRDNKPTIHGYGTD